MGWGNSKKAATPQPAVAAPKFPIAQREEDDTKHSERMAMAPEPVVKEVPTDAAKARLEWHALKSKKGWTDTTLAMLLYEFIDSKALFAELVKYSRRR